MTYGSEMHEAAQTVAFTSFQGELWLANEALPQAHPGLTSGSRYLISGMPDPHRLRTALQTLYAHVPLLGATLRLDDGKVMPEIDLHAELAPDFEYVDLSSAPDPQAACDAFEMRFREQRYDLFGGSLMQVRLLRLGASRACLLMRAFHAIADGLTLIAHFETLLHIYNALAEGRSPALGEPCDWPAVVAADQAWQVSAQAARDRTFWVEHLRALPDERLFVPRPGLPDRLDETGLSQIDLSAAAIADLEALEAQHRCSAGMLLLALHALVLGRVFDHERVCVQMPLSLGERKDLHRAQGYRVAVVPLNVDLRGEQTLATLLQALRRQSVSLMRHARTPYQRAAREAGLHLPPGLADTNVNYLPVVPGGDGQDFLLSDFGSLVSRHEPVILGVYAVESRIQGRRGLKLTVVHRRTYFDVEDVRRHVRRIEALLAAFRADDGLLLHAAPCLLPEEQAQLEGWEEGASLDFVQGTIWQLFERQALASADAPAVVAPDGSRQDYRTLRARALGVADWVRRAGVMPGQVVAVLARRDPALPAILLGILRAGAVYLPVDPDYPPERIRHMLSDSGARRLLALHADDLRLAPEGLAGLSAECLPAHLPGPESPGGASSGVGSLSEDGGDALPEVTPEAPAYLIYTSGSTGQPKGVLVPHAGFVNMIQGQAHLLGLRPGVRVLQFASPSFDASLSEIFMALTTGGTLYPVTREMIDAPWALRDYLSRNGIAVVTWPPSYLALFGREPLPGVRVLITAGEAPIGEDVRHYAAEKVYVNAYGPTETSVCATLTRLHPVLADGQPHSIGRPLPNTSCHVLDRHGRRLPPGMSGELYLGGAGVGIGYLNRPQLSAERFVRLATLGGRRVYRTGDRACWTENGELMLIGRMDEQVKLRGHRVELGEIVAVLERHPAVSQAAVLVNRSQRGGVWLLAFVAGAPVAELQAGALADWLRGRLPEYMLPNRYYRLDALPVSPAGKVDKAALLRLDEQALASTGPARPAGGLEQGGTSTEGVDAHALAQLCAHYEAVLGRPVSDPAADFMALGGDSLQAMVLARRLSQAYRQPVAVRDLLAGGAPLSVCRRLQPPGTAGTAPREDGQGVAASGTQQLTAPALTQGQFQLWVLDCLQAAEARYNMPLAVTLQGGEARVRDFMSALIASIEAQPACRSRFVGDIDAPRMDILPASGVHAEWLDLRTADDAQAQLVALIDERVHRPFRLSEAPLLRLSVFRLGAQAWCVLLVMHHIIGDADSLALLLAEAARRCADEDDDVGTARAPDPVSDPALRAAALAQFAADERLYLESTARRDDLAYWQRCLLPLPARLDLVPGQGPRSTARGQGGMVRCALPDGMAAKLQTLASHSGTTLLGAFIGLTCDWLHRRSGQDDLCVALPIGLRDTPELQHTVGYCVNTVLLRSRQASAAGMERVRLLGEQLRAALAHGRHPFSLLPAALGETRDPARGPLVDVMLTLIDQAALLDGLDRAGTGLRFGLHDVALRAAKFDYTFMLVSGAEGCLSLALEHDLSVCTHEQAGTLLDALAEDLARQLQRWQAMRSGAAEAAGAPPAMVVGKVAAGKVAEKVVDQATRAASGTHNASNGASTGTNRSASDRARECLSQAWQAVLGGAAPEMDSHFFACGGDSIKAIQVVGQLRRQGVDSLAPAAFFATPLFADLLARIQAGHGAQQPQHTWPRPEVGQALPLLPMHRRFMQMHGEHWRHFHMALPLRVGRDIDSARLQCALHTLQARHEALRMVFDGGCARLSATPAPPVWLERPAVGCDLTSPASAAGPLAPALNAAAQALFAALHPGEGPLWGAVLLHAGDERLLLLGGHHFVLDAVSLDLLRSELLAACLETQDRDAPACTSVTAPGTSGAPGLASWMLALQQPSLWPDAQAVEAWRARCVAPAGPLAGVCDAAAAGDVARRAFQRRQVSGFARRALAEPDAALLAGLSVALQRMGQREPVLLTLEGHGRQALAPGLEISQAVGWFTAIRPLHLPVFADPQQAAASLRDLLQQAQGGTDFALACLRAAAEGHALPDERPQISLNYLGQLSPVADPQDENAPPQGLQPLPALATPEVLTALLPAGFVPEAELELLAFFDGDRLCLSAWHAPARLPSAWVQALLDRWVETLCALTGQPLLAADARTQALLHTLVGRAECAVEQVVDLGEPDPAQQAMLFQHVLDGEGGEGGEGATPAGRGGASYTQQISFRLQGGLEADRLERAWAQVVARHESLRTVFPSAPGEGFHRLVLSEGRYTLARHDLRTLPAVQRQRRRDALLQAQRDLGLPPETGPLLHLHLLQLQPDEWEMSWCFHHLLMDGWCIGILLRELFTVYAGLQQGPGAEGLLPPAPPLSAYRQWLQQRESVSAPAHQAALAGWRTLLAELPEATLIGAHRPNAQRPAAGAADAAEWVEHEWALSAADGVALAHAAAACGVSQPQLLQALWAVLLGAVHAGRRDVLFGLVSAGRPAEVPGIEHMVGLFIRTLPLRARWAEGDTLAALSASLRQQAAERAAHEFLPLADIQALAGERGGQPLFDHILVFENYPLEGIEQPGAPRIAEVSGFERHPYVLSLSVLPGQAPGFRLVCRTDGFAEGEVLQLVRAWQRLLERVCAAGEAASTLSCTDLLQLPPPFLRVRDALGLQRTFNRTARDYPRDASLVALFRAVRERQPDAPACMAEHGEVWTYAQLDCLSDRVAAALGVLPDGTPVALAMPREPQAVVAMLGVLKAGGCYLPLDEKSPPQRLSQQLTLAACKRLLYRGVPPREVQAAQGAALQAFDLDAVLAEDCAAATLPPAGERRTPAGERVTPAGGGQAPACILFTSGSTGTPKGVMVPQRGIVRLVCNSDFWDLAPGERLLQAAPLGFDASSLEIWGALLCGGTSCFISDDSLLSPSGLARRIETQQIRVMWLTAGLFNLLADESPGLFAPLRRLFIGGEALSPAHVARVMQACPALALFNGYGPTENSTFSTTHRIDPADLQQASIPIGRPVANSRVYILDDRGAPTLPGEAGELCVAGDGLSPGYIGRDDLTQACFVDLPPPLGERVYRTGDLGCWLDDGTIRYLGRRDAQIKLRGYRIELSEVESALNRLDGVRRAAVMVAGSGEDRHLLALLCPERDVTPDPEALLAALAGQLPAYMLPQAWVRVDALPINANGKLDRAALPALAGQGMRLGAPARVRAVPEAGEDTSGEGADGADALESRIAAVFAELLGVPVLATEVDADFFALGGQSLKAMRLLARLEKTLGVRLPLREVMHHATVGALAARVRERLAAQPAGPARGGEDAPERASGQAPGDALQPPAVSMIVPVGEWPDYPLSSGQERLWFLQRLQPQASTYNVPFAVAFATPVDERALDAALGRLEARHDALRLRMPDSLRDDGTLRQTLASAGALRLTVCACDSEPARAASMAADLARPFAFGAGAPLVRAALYRLAEARSGQAELRGQAEGAARDVLLLVFHHLVCDGWSGEVLFRELREAYAAAASTATVLPTPQWPVPALRYVDYAVWQRGWLEGAEAAAMRARWVARLSPLPEALSLPTDRPRPALRDTHGGVLKLRIGSALEAALRQRAQAAGQTLFTLLLGVVKLWLYRHAGQRDLVVGVPVAGRTDAALHPLVGFLVNTVPVRTRLVPEQGFDHLLAQVAGSLGEALEDQAYPLESLVQALKVPRDSARNPLFDVLVAYEGREWAHHDTGAGPAGGAPQGDGHALPAMQPYPLTSGHSRLDLGLYFREQPEGLTLELEYASALFEQDTMARMAERLQVLLDAVCTRAPDEALDRLPWMSADEREQVLHGFNDTAEPWSLEASIDDCFRRQCARNPHAVALRGRDGAVLDHAQLDARVTRLAHELLAAGVRPGRHVGVCGERSVELIVAIFAVLRVGAVYVPLLPGLPQERLASMAEDMPGLVVLAEASQLPVFGQLGLTAWPIGGALEGSVGGPVRGPDAERQQDAGAGTDEGSPCASGTGFPPVPADAVAYVIFTSGSTGRPKGVEVVHRGVLNRLFWMQSRFPLDASDVILQKTPVSFDVSVWELFWWSWSGASLALLAPGDERDPAAIVRAIERHRVTVMHFVPSMLRAFVEHLETHPDAVPRLASLRRVFASGEALTPELVQRFNRLLHARHASELHNLYGPTEATVDVSWYPCLPLPGEPAGMPASVPIGRPISNTRLYVLDALQQPVPVGVCGELYIAGVQLARGYLARPGLTAERFVPDPFMPGERMYRSGDLARWLPDGNIEYLGRCDDQVKIRGFRIELGEVEAALERCEGVAQAVVRVGEVGGMPALEAFVVPRAGHVPEAAALRSGLHAFLPDYMCPSLFYRLDSLPLSASGKADRKALRGVRLGGASAARGATPDSARGAVPGMNAAEGAGEGDTLEQALCALWSEILPEAGEIGPDDGFFDIGGSSLLLIRLHEALEARWPELFSLPELFVSVTPRQQALHIRARNRGPGSVQAMEQATGACPVPVPAQGAVAVIGLALRLSDYDDPDSFWSDLLSGADRVGELSAQRREDVRGMLAAMGVQADPARLRPAAFLDDIAGFDCRRFGLAPGDATLLDPEQRLFLETAARALEDAGYGGQALDGQRVGVFVGASPSQAFKEAISRSFPERAEEGYILNVPSSVATRLGYLHDWDGPAELVDTACSSSLKAVRDACQALQRGECTVALAGGARVLLTPLRGDKAFAIETRSGRTRTFDAAADGVGAGEGAVALLLKPLAAAQADGDAIHAVILGSAVNQDGRSSSMAAPSPAAQARVILAAAREAGVPLDSVDFFEAHGTATVLGDPIEIDGLRRAFSAVTQAGETAQARPPLIASVKGNFGHLDAAAGALGMARAILALARGVVPAQAHFERPNPRLELVSAPVEVAARNHPLPPAGRPWRAGVSAFGLSGINVHVLLEQAPRPGLPAEDGRWHCVPLSAGSQSALRRYVRALIEALAAHPEWPLQAIAATLIAGREHLACRLAVQACSRDGLLQALLDWWLEAPGAPVCSGLLADGKHRRPVPTDPCVQAAGLPDEHAARAAAQAFVGGAMPQWPQAEPLYRVHLPPAPMERQRCWPVFRPLAGARRPCLSGPWVTPEGSVFPLALSAEDFWPVAEHVLAGQPTLVGMALPGLLLEAAGRVGGGAGGAGRAEGGWSIGALHWLRPLSVAQLVPDSVNLTLVAQADGSWRARLRGCVQPAQAPSVPDAVGAAGEAREGDEWHDFAEATLTPHPARSVPPAPLEVAALRVGMQPVERPASSAIEAGGALQVSARWDCRRKTWRSEDGRRTLAWLVLDERWLGDLDDFPWHPAMLDVAASLALDGGGRVPAACREMRLHAPPGRAFYALASRREAQDGDLRRTQPGALHVDCVLFDADGRVLAEWLGLVFVPMQAPAARLHALHWQDIPWPAGPVQAHAGGDTVLIGAGPECAALARALQDRGRVCRVFALPQDEAQRSALVAGVLADGVTQVVQVLPGGEEDCGWPQAAMLRALLRAGLRRPLPWWTLGQGALAGVAPEPGLARTGEPAAALALGLMLSLRQEEAALLGCHVECPEWPAAEGVLDLLDRLDPSDAEPLRLLSGREGHAAGQAPVLQPPVLQRRVLGPAQPVDERPAGGLPEGEALPEWPRPLLSRPPAGSCLLVTGGLGAMALTLVAALARAWREAVPVALLHRAPFALPADGDLLAAARQARLAGDPLRAERLNALHTLREQGVAWTLFECDVSDAAALHATLAEVRRQLGAPGGVLHTAGVAGGGFLLGRSREAYEAVLAPKVRATRLLHEATLHDPLAFFVMMSSRTALLGAPGQGDYAAANAYLDAFAGWRRAQGLPALSMAWNTWAQIGMAVRHGAYDPAHPALLPGQAGAVLVQALGGAQDGAQGRGSSHVVVSVAGEFLPGERAQAGPSAGSQKGAQPAPDEPSLSVAQRVLRAVGEELGYAQTGTPLTLEDDFYALGGDSISGLRIVNRLARELGRQVSLADLFANSRLGDLAQAIGDRDTDAGAGADEATTATDPSAHHGGGAVDGPRPAPLSARHVLSWEQLAVVQAEALALPNTGFNLPQFLRLPSGIGADRLRAALRVLMQRHEILRTRLVDLHAGEPAMEVLDPEACHLPFEQVRVAWLDDPAVERLLRPFRLDEAPLFRAALIESQADGPVLFLDIHHSMADAQGVQILLDELYRLCVHDPHGAHLPPAGLQQKEAAWWQRGDPARGAEALAQDARARAYWLAQYADAVPLVDLPADYPRPRHHTHRGGVVSFEVPAGWLPAIRSLARAHATTAFTVMLGLWSVLLARASGRDELVIAVAVDGREHEAFARTAGMFASLLPLRLRPGRAASLAELFEQHHRQHGEALRHRSFMVNRLLAELKLPMMPERTPLTEISFSYMNFAGVSKTGEGFEALQRLNPASKGDLSIFGSDTGERLGFALEYYADLFAHARIEGLAEAFLQLLRRVLDQGTAALPFSYLPLADPMTHRAGAAPGVPPPSSREAARAGGGTPAPGEASEPSGGAVLDRVLAVFRTVFEQAELGPDDSFFELGGHSLLGLQIVNQLLRLPGGEGLNIRDLFDHPSPAAMAARIGVLAGQRGGQGPIVARPAAPDGLYPLSHAQQRLYVLHHTDEGAVAYNMPFMFRLDRAPDAAGLARLRDALLALCARHEVLRTVFVEQDGQLWQKVVAPRVPAFIVDDVYGAETPDQAQAQALQLAAGDALRPFDLGEAPLMRLRLCRLPDGQALLSLVMHHVIGDGWSMQVFLGEWLALHEALSQGRPAGDALPPLPLQYRDYALWQQGRDWSEEAAYWRDCLSGAPSRIALPVDAPPGACGAGVLMHTLPPALVEALRGHARQRGVSLATLMLTLFVALLYRLTRQQDMVIGMGVAGRERAELEGLIGFFVNILPVRVRLDDDTELDGLLDRVHRASVEAQARQDYPFDLLVRALQQGAGGARQSLLNVMFEYQRYSDLKGINRVQAQSAGALSGTPLDPVASLSANKAGEGVQEGATMLAKYDLTLFVQDEPSACRLKLEYDRALLSDATAAQWLAYLERFMQMATAAPAPAASPEQ